MINTEDILKLKQKRMSVEDIAQWLYENGVNDVSSFKRLDLEPDLFTKNELQKIEEYLSGPNADKDDDFFRKCTTMDDYDQYLKKFPKGKHRDEARDKILEFDTPMSPHITDTPKPPHASGKKLLKKIIIDCKEDDSAIIKKIRQNKDYISKDDILSCLKENHNLFGLNLMLDLKELFSITEQEIAENLGVDIDIIYNLFEYKDKSKDLSHPSEQNPNDVIPPCTEVYFWGVPSSGKTCALGAILRCFEKYFSFGEMGTDIGYMNDLKSCFKEIQNRDYCVLPKSTYVKDLYQMQFTLKKDKDSYPFTFIDISGEACRAMSDDLLGKLKHHSEMEDKTDREIILDYLIKLLESDKNRKIHFFLCEYNAADKEYEGRSQISLLSEIATYIAKHKTFNKSTDAIYLLITKADNNIPPEVIKKYAEENYQPFRNTMKAYCEKHEINDGNIQTIPFSIGNAFLGNYCIYNSQPSQEVIEKILTCAYKDNNSIIGKMKKLFRK